MTDARSNVWGHQAKRRSLLRVCRLLALGQLWLTASASTPTSVPTNMGQPSLVFADDSLEENVYLFAFRMGPTIQLSDSLPGYAYGNNVLVPLGEMARLLGLAITVKPRLGMAEGFILQEHRTFKLDVLKSVVEVAGKTFSVDRTRLELHETDIFVDIKLLSEWWPVNFNLDLKTLVMDAQSREKLPIEEQLERSRRALGLAYGETRESLGKRLQREETPYQLISTPAVDLNLQGEHQQTPSDRNTHGRATVYASGDLLYMESNAYFNLNAPGGLSDFRMTLGRRDPAGGLLGRLDARAFAVGEIFSQGVNLVSLPQSGTGFMVSSFPLQQDLQFGRRTLRGVLPPGWQAELYRNGALLGFQTSRADGLYEFQNVPLVYGLNDLRIVLYGPQGQRREEVFRSDVNPLQTPEGVFHYRVQFLEPRMDRGRGSMEAAYGLSDNLSLATSFVGQRLERDEDPQRPVHDYGTLTLRGFWNAFSAQLTAAKDIKGGNAFEGALQTRMGSSAFTLRHAELFQNYQSEQFLSSIGLLRRHSEVEVTSVLPHTRLPIITLDFGGRRDENLVGGSAHTLYLRASSGFYGYFLSHSLERDWVRPEPTQRAFSTTRGELLVSKFTTFLNVRGNARYRLDQGRRLEEAGLLAESTWLLPNFNIQVGCRRMVESREDRFNVGLYRYQGRFALGAQAEWSQKGNWSALVNLQVGLGREPRRHAWHMDARSAARSASVSALAFLDANGNGILDPGEKPIPEATFMVDGQGRPETTDRNGVAFLQHLGDGVDTVVSLNPSSLEDPALRPSIPGRKILTRSGLAATLDYPVVGYGEMEGTVYREENTERIPQAGLLLDLLDASGKTVRQVRSSFDGFYTFQDIPPGAYTLRVNEQDAARLDLAPMAPRSLHFNTTGTLLEGQTMLVRLKTPRRKMLSLDLDITLFNHATSSIKPLPEPTFTTKLKKKLRPKRVAQSVRKAPSKPNRQR